MDEWGSILYDVLYVQCSAASHTCSLCRRSWRPFPFDDDTGVIIRRPPPLSTLHIQKGADDATV